MRWGELPGVARIGAHGPVLAYCAVCCGPEIGVERPPGKGVKTTMRHIGLVLAGLWLVLTGLIELVGLRFQGLPEVMAMLAIVAGVLVIIRR